MINREESSDKSQNSADNPVKDFFESQLIDFKDKEMQREKNQRIWKFETR